MTNIPVARAPGPLRGPRRARFDARILSFVAISLATFALLLTWSGTRGLLGEVAFHAALMALWYAPVYVLLKRLRIGMDWVEESRFSPPKAALFGALIGAAYCGLPTALLFTAAHAVATEAAPSGAFAATMRSLAFVLVVPGSLATGGLWGALVGQPRSTMRPMKWRVRVLTGEDAEQQAKLLRSILRRYRLRGESASGEPANYSFPVHDPELGEAIIAELGPVVKNAEVVNAPE